MEKPDHDIELFWFGLKDSMNNFYKDKDIKRPIIYWSDTLNYLQKKENYKEIENNIRNYISLYGIDIIRYNDCYHFNILKSNIKRWNVICNNFKFMINDNKKYFNIIFLLLDIYPILYKKLSNEDMLYFSSQIELLILYEDFDYLINICLKYELISIFDKLNNYINLNDIINKKYNLDLKYKMNGRKIFSIIKKINL